MKSIIRLQVNGDSYEVAVEPWHTLLDVLRDQLRLTGTKKSCGIGTCGVCTVIMDGRAVLSCLKLAVESEEKEITTIEGLANVDNLHPIQDAFVTLSGMQCGFCTPGMILSVKTFLDQNRHPTEEEARKAISGNLCRCTGYSQIIDAVMQAAEKTRKET